MKIYPTGVMLHPNSARVLVRPFISTDPERVAHIIERALTLPDAEVDAALDRARADFAGRHSDIEPIWLRHFRKVAKRCPGGLSHTRQLYIGALFSGEYALESAALFNPSIVPHPDQSGASEGELRFIMSLRATGEGHISSIEFRTGTIHRDYSISLDEVSPFVTAPELDPDPTFLKPIFTHKLEEMGFTNPSAAEIVTPLGERFTLSELDRAIAAADKRNQRTHVGRRTMECVRWLAESNYGLHFKASMPISERILFPVSSNESNGIEDARFVRFINDDGSAHYYATYTAYNGRSILPQLLETPDFQHFAVLTLNGRAVQNKGMALFPRKVGGCYLMLSRQDDENLFLMRSENPHFWSDPVLLRRPVHGWEAVKIGNCGSPIETERGWLVITHGVGPMRKYCIGAILLDREDPSRVVAQLSEPLLAPEGNEREGYVPNVVYSCGSLVHGSRLVLPYGISDSASAIVTLELEELFEAMTPA